MNGKKDIFWGYKWWHVKYVNFKQKQIEDAKKRKEKDNVGWTGGAISASVGALRTLRSRQNEDVTVGWSDSLVSRCTGWITEENKRNQ
jgi:hypothetical protein